MEIPKFNIPDMSKYLSGLSGINPITSQPNYMGNMQMRDGGMTHIEEMSAEEFLNILYQSGENYHLGKTDSIIRVGGNVTIDSKKFNKKYGVIENFEFEHSVIFTGNNKEDLFCLGECIVFLNCKFERKLFFQDCKFDLGKTTHGSYEPNSIEILGGYLKEISLDNCELNGILFSEFESESLKIDHIDIKNCNFLTGSISLESIEVSIMCDINFNSFAQGSLRFTNNKILCGCRFAVNKNVSIHFYGKESIFEKPVFIYHGEYRSIDFNDVHFFDEVTLISCSIESEIKLVGNTFEDRLWILSKDDTNGSISTVTPDEIWIQNNKFQNGFKYNSEQNIVDSLLIIFSEKSSGVMEFEDSVFNTIEIMGTNFNNSLFFRDCIYTNLRITNFFNKALVSFNNNFPNHTNAFFEELKIENSNLGNTEFYDFDFRVYDKVRIIDSRLDNIFVNGVEWFESRQLEVDERESDQKKILSHKREIYRQLQKTTKLTPV